MKESDQIEQDKLLWGKKQIGLHVLWVVDNLFKHAPIRDFNPLKAQNFIFFGGFAPWTPTGTLSLDPAGGLRGPQTPGLEFSLLFAAVCWKHS